MLNTGKRANKKALHTFVAFCYFIRMKWQIERDVMFVRTDRLQESEFEIEERFRIARLEFIQVLLYLPKYKTSIHEGQARLKL